MPARPVFSEVSLGSDYAIAVHHHGPMQAGVRRHQRDPPAQGCFGFLAAVALLPAVAIVTFLVIELIR